MNKILAAIILALGISAAAQTPVNGTCSVTIPASFTVNSFGIVGTSVPNGVYGVQVTNNLITSVAALPATGGGSSAPPATGTTYTVSAPAQQQYVVAWLPVPGLTVKPGQVWSVTPVFSGAPSAATLNYLLVTPWVNSAGAMYLRVSNSSAIPAMNYTVTVQ